MTCAATSKKHSEQQKLTASDGMLSRQDLPLTQYFLASLFPSLAAGLSRTNDQFQLAITPCNSEGFF